MSINALFSISAMTVLICLLIPAPVTHSLAPIQDRVTQVTKPNSVPDKSLHESGTLSNTLFLPAINQLPEIVEGRVLSATLPIANYEVKLMRLFRYELHPGNFVILTTTTDLNGHYVFPSSVLTATFAFDYWVEIGFDGVDGRAVRATSRNVDNDTLPGGYAFVPPFDASAMLKLDSSLRNAVFTLPHTVRWASSLANGTTYDLYGNGSYPVGFLFVGNGNSTSATLTEATYPFAGWIGQPLSLRVLADKSDITYYSDVVSNVKFVRP